MQNGHMESFNKRMRDELLNEALFHSLNYARALIREWAEDYNTRRPPPPPLLDRIPDPSQLR